MEVENSVASLRRYGVRSLVISLGVAASYILLGSFGGVLYWLFLGAVLGSFYTFLIASLMSGVFCGFAIYAVWLGMMSMHGESGPLRLAGITGMTLGIALAMMLGFLSLIALGPLGLIFNLRPAHDATECFALGGKDVGNGSCVYYDRQYYKSSGFGF